MQEQLNRIERYLAGQQPGSTGTRSVYTGGQGKSEQTTPRARAVSSPWIGVTFRMAENGQIVIGESSGQPTIPVGRPGSQRHIAALDGVRGVAILAVFLNHQQVLNMGWMGVDLFFVLSGYLITTILRRSRSRKDYWRSFWIKRVTRILPAFALLLVLAGPLGFRLSFKQLVAYVFTFGDVLAYLGIHNAVVGSVWSLAVEEHFYMLWPLAVRYLPRKSLLYVLGGLLILEPASRAVTTVFTHNWRLFYYSTPFRLDGLAMGCMLALLLESRRMSKLITRWSGPAALFSVGSLLAVRIALGKSFTFGGSTMSFNSACYSLTACVSVCLIAYLLQHPESISSRIISFKPLVLVGTISYGLYLYNVLVTDTVNRLTGWSGAKATALNLITSVLAAWISFTLYEKPLIRWGRRIADARSSHE